MKFKSSFEKDGFKLLSKSGWLYEDPTEKVKYTVNHSYQPDFTKKGKPLLEFKGRFKTREEASKYIWIKKCNPNIELIFVFQNPDAEISFAYKRKNGKRMTYAEWAVKNNFQYYTLATIPTKYL